jgi:hypothetical protein
LGALDTLRTLPDLSGEQMVERALQTASKFSGGVRPPFVILAHDPAVQSLTEPALSGLEVATPQQFAKELLPSNPSTGAACEIAAEAPES